jgi:hypothetical protein
VGVGDAEDEVGGQGDRDDCRDRLVPRFLALHAWLTPNASRLKRCEQILDSP